jgi:hypothetical protein
MISLYHGGAGVAQDLEELHVFLRDPNPGRHVVEEEMQYAGFFLTVRILSPSSAELDLVTVLDNIQ